MGALIDRWDRRRAMILSDAGAGLEYIVIIMLLMAGRLELWHIYLAEFLSGTCGALRMPALTAATTQLVPKERLGRASGLLQTVQVGQFLISPIAAGLLIDIIGLQGVVLIDLITFLFAIFTLFIVYIPKPNDDSRRVGGQGIAGARSRVRLEP